MAPEERGSGEKKNGIGRSSERRGLQKDTSPEGGEEANELGELVDEQAKTEGNRQHESFHHYEGEAATSPVFTFGTGVNNNPTSQLDAAADSGMGRNLAGKEKECGDGNVRVREILSWLSGKLDLFLDRLCKTKPTGRLFPLPTSFFHLGQAFPNSPTPLLEILVTLVVSLNSLNGEGVWNDGSPSNFQKQVLEELFVDCKRVYGWMDSSTPVTGEGFFKCRGVDHRGEEVLAAQSMQWENVQSTLPAEVGQVDLSSVVELGSLHYVQHFEEYLLPPEDQIYTRPPKVMVPPSEWERFCGELLQRGVFSKIHEDDLHQVSGQPLLNGLFGVSKGDYTGHWENLRVIMNLVPVNKICRSIEGDVSTLPSWAGMSPLQLMPDEDLVISSEDVRCFFYIFKIPSAWHRCLAFNRPLPHSLCGAREGKWYPCSAVLPMGFKNSVSLAQHVHRYIVKQALQYVPFSGEAELRKDKPFSSSNPQFRIYLDNFDELRKVSKPMAEAIEGKVSPLVTGLREEYLRLGVPRHPKKGVASQRRAEVRGAIVDGSEGLAFPKPEKILKYLQLAQLILQQETCTQKEAQVVGGGFVYFAMFRCPLLGCFNFLWKFITSFQGYPPFVKLPIPPEVKEELSRFMGLIPLAYMDFRCKISKQLTASDASTSGGGVTVSTGATPAGYVASACQVRGDLIEPSDVTSVLTIGLFDGIGALRVAADSLGWNVAGHISVEISASAQRVVESRFPSTVLVTDILSVDLATVKDWARKFSQVGLVLLGAGPPCQGVSGLNAARKGALRDARSSLYIHVAQIRDLVKQCFPWAQVRSLMESVSSMDEQDEKIMSDSFGCRPWHIDAAGVSLARRPRLYWIEWELWAGTGVHLFEPEEGRAEVQLTAEVQEHQYLQPGWKKCSSEPFPTFTTARPREKAGYKPAGLRQCEPDAIERWQADQLRFPPYQYRRQFTLQNKHGETRIPDISEREVIMGFPRDYTMQCMPKAAQGTQNHLDTRLSLIGNTWNVTVITWLLSQLGQLLGLNEGLSPQQIVSRTAPGCTKDLQTFLQRPLMTQRRAPPPDTCEETLVKKLLTLVSVKGEDLMLQSSSEDLVRYHRLRASIPAKLWRWRAIASWRWSDQGEHINSLELRAVLTALRWRIERNKCIHSKFIHLVDSQVCLHALSRGRSSSKKLRRTLLRSNALLLATKTHVVWAYVHAEQNPADAPSRRLRKRKWTHAQETS